MLLVLGVGASSLGCSKIAEKIAEKATEKVVAASAGAESADIDTKTGSVTLTGKDGSKAVVGSATTMPEDWPAEVPVYPKATLTSAMSLKNQGKAHHTVSFETADKPSEVVKFYTAKLGGYEKKNELVMNGNVTLGFEKGKRTVMVMSAFNPGDEKGVITLAVTDAP